MSTVKEVIEDRRSIRKYKPDPIPDEFLLHFIRGEFDGDGCNCIAKVEKYKYLVSTFTGNIDFLTVLKDKIKKQADIDTNNIYSLKNCNPVIGQLTYNGKKAIALGDYIYQDSENLRLERKFKIYDKMKKQQIKKDEKKKLKTRRS